MKISLYSITLGGGYYRGPAVPLLDIFRKAKAWGYDGVQIEGKRPHGSPLDLDGAARTAIKKAAKDNGLEIPCVSTYSDFTSPIEEHRENELLMCREIMRLAADVGAPFVRVLPAWSGVTRRDGVLTYDIARHNFEHRYSGVTAVERWCFVRDCLAEASKMAEKIGVTLAFQNHGPVITNYPQLLEMIRQINSPALKACLDAPCMECHSEEYYRKAIKDTGNLMVYSHFGGRFERLADGKAGRWVDPGYGPYTANDYAFLKAAKELINYQGHFGYELCSPVLTNHRFEGLEYAMLQAELAAKYMRQVINSL